MRKTYFRLDYIKVERMVLYTKEFVNYLKDT
jgi:hypothetical protein